MTGPILPSVRARARLAAMDVPLGSNDGKATTCSRLLILLCLCAPVPSRAEPDMDCAPSRQFTARAGYVHGDYSFAGAENDLEASLQDRDFHGWNATAATSYANRFALTDYDLGLSATRALPWRDAYAGLALGGAARGDILPSYRGELLGGLALGPGLSAEGSLAYRRYDVGDVYLFAPSLSWEWRGLNLSAAYWLSDTRYDSGGDSGAISSYRFKLGWSGYCRVQPWAAFARTKEPFQPGAPGAVEAFSAEHYSVGATFHPATKWAVDAYYERENRLLPGEDINWWGLASAYSWGKGD